MTLTAKKPAGEFPIRDGERQRGRDVLQTPSGAVYDVSYDGRSQLRHGRRCYPCRQERVSAYISSTHTCIGLVAISR